MSDRSMRQSARLQLAADISTWIDEQAKALKANTGNTLTATEAAHAIRTSLLHSREPWREGNDSDEQAPQRGQQAEQTPA